MTEDQLRNDFALLQKLYREDPKKHRIRYAIGCVCVAPIQPEDAEELYRQALTIFTDLEASGADFTAAWLASAHRELGILLSDRGDDENAEAHLRQALARFRQPMGHPAHRHVDGEKLAACAVCADRKQNGSAASKRRSAAVSQSALFAYGGDGVAKANLHQRQRFCGLSHRSASGRSLQKDLGICPCQRRAS